MFSSRLAAPPRSMPARHAAGPACRRQRSGPTPLIVRLWAGAAALVIALLLSTGPAHAAKKPHKPTEPKHPTVRVHHISYGKVIPAGRATRLTISPRHRLRVSVP